MEQNPLSPVLTMQSKEKRLRQTNFQLLNGSKNLFIISILLITNLFARTNQLLVRAFIAGISGNSPLPVLYIRDY
jgi:hypothetical protein